MNDPLMPADKSLLPSLSDPLHHRFDPAWSPAVDVYESAGSYHVVLEAPGIHACDVRVGLIGDLLAITAVRHRMSCHSGIVPHRVERNCGRMSRRIALPGAPESGSLRWQLRQGLLRITIRRCRHPG